MTLRRILPAACALALLTVAPALAQSRPPAQIKITNARTVPLESLEITTTGEQARLVGKLAKPLAPGKSIAVKLNKPAGCSYFVLARFDDAVESDAEDMNLCKDKVIRLTE